MAIRLRTWMLKIIWSFRENYLRMFSFFRISDIEIFIQLFLIRFNWSAWFEIPIVKSIECSRHSHITFVNQPRNIKFYLITSVSAKFVLQMQIYRDHFLRITDKAILSFVSFIDYDIYCSHFFCSHSFQIELSKAKNIIRQWIFMSKTWCIQCFTSWLWRDSAFPGIFPTFCVVRRKRMLSSWICVPSKWFIKSNNRSERLENFQHWEQSHQQNKHSLSHNLSYCRQCEQIKKTRDKMKQNKWEKTYSHRRIWRS